MSDVVVDSSVAVKWFLPEPDSADAVRVRNDVFATGGELIVLDLLFPEACNAIWKAERQQKVSHAAALQALGDLQAFPFRTERAARLLDEAYAIAVKYDRAFYDALFVALTDDLNIKGVTADEPLYNVMHADFQQIILLRNWP